MAPGTVPLHDLRVTSLEPSKRPPKEGSQNPLERGGLWPAELSEQSYFMHARAAAGAIVFLGLQVRGKEGASGEERASGDKKTLTDVNRT